MNILRSTCLERFTSTRGVQLRLVAFCLSFVVGLSPGVSYGVVLIVRGTDRSVAGFRVREDSESIVIRESISPGKWRERTYRKSELADVIDTVSEERLKRLRADNPSGYRDYAEELSEKRQDPEAREMAIRLLIIAADRAPDKLGRSAVLAMIDLARDPAEAARFRALAFLLDADHDRRILKAAPLPGNDAKTRGEGSGRARNELAPQLALALKQLRRGDRDSARKCFERAAARGEFMAIGGIIAAEELSAACDERPLSAATLRKLVLAEMALIGYSGNPPLGTPAGPLGKLPASAQGDGDENRWSRDLVREGEAVVAELSVPRITEFDPRLCEYWEGKWVVPREGR